MTRRVWRLCLLGLCVVPGLAQAGLSVWNVATRYDLERQRNLELRVLADVPEKVDAVLIDMGNSATRDIIKQSAQGPTYGVTTIPYVRIRRELGAANVALLTPAAPEDHVDGVDFRWRDGPAHIDDLRAVVKEARQRFPNARIFIGGYASSTVSVLNAANSAVRDVEGYIIIGGFFFPHRNDSLSGISARGLVIQARGQLCADSSMIEAREVSAMAHWTLVEAWYAKPDSAYGCSTSRYNALAGQEKQYSRLILDWMKDGANAPASIGADKPADAYVESVHMIEGGSYGLFGKNQLEMTLLTPPGQGPFPLVVYNHGDVDLDPQNLSRHKRFRDLIVAREFLALGFAVAQPARPGIGRSSGNYPKFSSAFSASQALEKGEEHAREAFAAIHYLRTLPQIDADRIILSGQSAGGFASVVGGSRTPPPPWLKAVIDFSGGRTDVAMGKVSQGLLKPMIDAFGEAGKTSRLPELWIFAENDSRYSTETIRASYEAFVASGGTAELLLFPPLKGDGHFVHHEPEKWRAGLRQFMDRNALLSPAAAGQPALAIARERAGAEE